MVLFNSKILNIFLEDLWMVVFTLHVTQSALFPSFGVYLESEC